MLGLMLAFVHAEPDRGPSTDALSLATLDRFLDFGESGESTGDGDDAEDHSKFLSFAELPADFTRPDEDIAVHQDTDMLSDGAIAR